MLTIKRSSIYIARLLQILNIILKLLNENKLATKREIYYLYCKNFES